jgi:hypothetical protein
MLPKCGMNFVYNSKLDLRAIMALVVWKGGLVDGGFS